VELAVLAQALEDLIANDAAVADRVVGERGFAGRHLGAELELRAFGVEGLIDRRAMGGEEGEDGLDTGQQMLTRDALLIAARQQILSAGGGDEGRETHVQESGGLSYGGGGGPPIR
jgi:hypothetical protein